MSTVAGSLSGPGIHDGVQFQITSDHGLAVYAVVVVSNDRGGFESSVSMMPGHDSPDDRVELAAVLLELSTQLLDEAGG